MVRVDPAPRAERIANSRRLLAACASCRLATLATPVANRSAAATKSISSDGRAASVNAESSGTTITRAGPFDPNTAMPNCPRLGVVRLRAVPSSAAWAAVIPGRNRPTASRNLTSAPTIHAIVSGSGNAKSGAITPATR